MIKFIFIGPESSGKTTLCKLLSEEFSTCWVSEMCRTMAEERTPVPSTEINFHFTLQDFVEMAHRQNTEEQKLALQANTFLICDNDSFALTIWCERYLGKYYHEIFDIYNNSGLNDNKIYILTKPNVPFVQDGLRDGEHIRDWMYERFLQELTLKNLKYYIIDSSDYDERVSAAIQIIKNNVLT